MRVRVLAGLIDIESMMRVLDGRHAQTPRGEARDHAHQQGGLACAAPAGDADHFHAVIIYDANAMPSMAAHYSQSLCARRSAMPLTARGRNRHLSRCRKPPSTCA